MTSKTNLSATAIAHPNIALIKYWGDRDPHIHLPASGSISMNLAELVTRTQVRFDPSLENDLLTLDGRPINGPTLDRVSKHLDLVRRMAEITTSARVDSVNNFPMGAGIASSASGFAALTLAATHAAGLDLDEAALSRLARLGSGSACRSIPGGFVEWLAGTRDEDSYAHSITPAEHWELVDCITIVSLEEKTVSSSVGHSLAPTSPLQPARLSGATGRLELCRTAILEGNFDALASVVELDSNLMHAVMMTSAPPLYYWQPATIEVMLAVESWRKARLSACFTIDAGPNVHVLCPSEAAGEVQERLKQLPGVIQVLISHPGGRAYLEVDSSDF